MKVTRQFRKPNFPPRLTRIAGPLTLLALLCVLVPSKALTEDHFWIDSSTGLALGGFDPVSYFTGAAPRRGSADYEYVWHAVAWRFENEGNLAAFKRDPEIYAPQYGGHAAVALGKGHLAPGNPRVFAVLGGRLYLFYSMSNKDEWLAMTEAQRVAAETSWHGFTR